MRPWPVPGDRRGRIARLRGGVIQPNGGPLRDAAHLKWRLTVPPLRALRQPLGNRNKRPRQVDWASTSPAGLLVNLNPDVPLPPADQDADILALPVEEQINRTIPHAEIGQEDVGHPPRQDRA